MSILRNLKSLIKGEKKLIDVWHYFVGNFRYRLYYSRFRFLIRKHIREQIEFRIKYMDKQCYEQGSCKMCGCTTTALQMCNKSCDKPCYPKMLNKKEWKIAKEYDFYFDTKNGIVWFIDDKDPYRTLRHMKADKFF